MCYDLVSDIKELFGNDYEIYYKTTKESPINYLWVTIAGRDYRIDEGNLMVEARCGKDGKYGSDFFAVCIGKELRRKRENQNCNKTHDISVAD